METAIALPAEGPSCLADEPWLGRTATETKNNVWFYYQILEQLYVFIMGDKVSKITPCP